MKKRTQSGIQRFTQGGTQEEEVLEEEAGQDKDA